MTAIELLGLERMDCAGGWDGVVRTVQGVVDDLLVADEKERVVAVEELLCLKATFEDFAGRLVTAHHVHRDTHG